MILMRSLKIGIILVVCLFIFGCYKILTEERNPDKSINIEKMNGLFNFHKIYVDSETKVMYLFVKDGKGAGLTTMLNSDGTPKTSENTSYKTVNISDIGGVFSFYNIYVDSETKVMYLCVKDGEGVGLTRMLNSDGSPKTSEGTSYKPINISDTGGVFNYHNIYVDSETKVMYLCIKDGYGLGLTTMLNSDGSPKTSEGTSYKTINVSDIGGVFSYYNIYVDAKTKAMYLLVKDGKGAEITTMLNSDGSPKTSEGTSYKTKNLSDLQGIFTFHKIYVDSETRVSYLFVKDGEGAGITTMVN